MTRAYRAAGVRATTGPHASRQAVRAGTSARSLARYRYAGPKGVVTCVLRRDLPWAEPEGAVRDPEPDPPAVDVQPQDPRRARVHRAEGALDGRRGPLQENAIDLHDELQAFIYTAGKSHASPRSPVNTTRWDGTPSCGTR